MKTPRVVALFLAIGALMAAPGCTAEKPSAEPHLKAGKEFLDKNDVPEALSELQLATQMDSTSAEAFYYKGLAESRMGMDMRALKSYNRCIQLDSLYARAYADRGGLRVMARDFKGAIPDLMRALELDEKGTGVNAFFNLGLSQFFSGNMSQSIDAMNGALRLNPKDGDALGVRGHAKLALGDTTGGCFDIKSALRLNSQLTAQLGKPPCP